MNKPIIILILLLLILHFLLNEYNIDGFQALTTLAPSTIAPSTEIPIVEKIFYIKDKNNILPDFKDDNLSKMINVIQYKNSEVFDKIVKMLKFNNSCMMIYNLNSIAEYTLLLNIEFVNKSVLSSIVNSSDIDGNLIFNIYSFNEKLYVKFDNKTYKFPTTLSTRKNYVIVINKTSNSLTVYFDDKLKKMTVEKIRLSDNSLNIGCIYKNNKIINPLDGFIGNINIYKEIINPYKLLGISSAYGTTVERNVEICKFIPKGNTLNSCKTMCKRENGCTERFCNEICTNCIDFNLCKWIKEPVNQTTIVEQKPDKPYPPKIKCLQRDSSIELRFKKPFDNYNPINKYLIKCRKTYVNDGFIKVATFDSNDCGKNSCKYVIHGLDNKDYYTISVQAVNSIGISLPSNEEIIAPEGLLPSKKISSALIESDEEIKKEIMKQFNYDNNYCDATSFINYDEHILDKIDDKYDIEEFIKNEYLNK